MVPYCWFWFMAAIRFLLIQIILRISRFLFSINDCLLQLLLHIPEIIVEVILRSFTFVMHIINANLSPYSLQRIQARSRVSVSYFLIALTVLISAMKERMIRTATCFGFPARDRQGLITMLRTHHAGGGTDRYQGTALTVAIVVYSAGICTGRAG